MEENKVNKWQNCIIVKPKLVSILKKIPFRQSVNFYFNEKESDIFFKYKPQFGLMDLFARKEGNKIMIKSYNCKDLTTNLVHISDKVKSSPTQISRYLLLFKSILKTSYFGSHSWSLLVVYCFSRVLIFSTRSAILDRHGALEMFIIIINTVMK